MFQVSLAPSLQGLRYWSLPVDGDLVGYDLPDGGIFVVAEDGDFYCIHHTGAYHLGSDEFEFFNNWVKGDLQSV
ncbi:SUKH-3 domain-containing protein [Streptomyces noursei]|uniref:SUKH-3 domain-containing protein n=1 Tax=Streptomyces noursei TaxID=1971 RepID=UPI0037946F52